MGVRLSGVHDRRRPAGAGRAPRRSSRRGSGGEPAAGGGRYLGGRPDRRSSGGVPSRRRPSGDPRRRSCQRHRSVGGAPGQHGGSEHCGSPPSLQGRPPRGRRCSAAGAEPRDHEHSRQAHHLRAAPGDSVAIGTTDTSYHGDQLLWPEIERADIEYLLQPVGRYFDVEPLTADDVIAAWSGVRPLVAQDGKEATEISARKRCGWAPAG